MLLLLAGDIGGTKTNLAVFSPRGRPAQPQGRSSGSGVPQFGEFPMNDHLFQTREGVCVPAVTAEQMREVDRIAVEEFGLGILQMMENAGSQPGRERDGYARRDEGRGHRPGRVGRQRRRRLCCARHLHNRGFRVGGAQQGCGGALRGPRAPNSESFWRRGAARGSIPGPRRHPSRADRGGRRPHWLQPARAPRGRAAELIDLCNQHAARLLSLDVPSGLDATTGETPGPVVHPDRTLTLALPKTGLAARARRSLPGRHRHPAGGLSPAGIVF